VRASLHTRPGKRILCDDNTIDRCWVMGYAHDLEFDPGLQRGQERFAYVHSLKFGDAHNPPLAARQAMESRTQAPIR
jgi:hypothetical protein